MFNKNKYKAKTYLRTTHIDIQKVKDNLSLCSYLVNHHTSFGIVKIWLKENHKQPLEINQVYELTYLVKNLVSSSASPSI